MKKKKKIYNYISDLELLELAPEWPLDDDAKDRALYNLGNVKIPRSMLMSKKFQSLKPSSKSVYLWLMAKEEIIRKKRRAFIEDKETEQKEGVITASRREIAKFTGIRSSHLKASIDDLKDADLVKMRPVKEGGKVIATVWQIAHWDIDKRGYVKMPLSVIISPAWQDLTHETRILYIALLSEHCSAKKKQGKKFPVFTFTYNQIRATYGLSKDTIRMKQGEGDKRNVEERMKTKRVRINESGNAKTGIRALEDTGLIICNHGKLIVTKDPEHPDDFKKNNVKQDLNQYKISLNFMYEPQEEPQEKDNDNNTENTGDTIEENEAIAE